jgi:hypothetical protein
MTRKDYELIAAVFKAQRTEYILEHHKYAVESAVLDMADALAAENPRFDRERFLAACGVE